MADHRHHWVRAPHRAARTQARAELPLPPVLAVVGADRRLRGPYTAVGTLLRALVPDALTRCPEAVRRHDVEILTTAPELRGVVPATRETLTSLAVPKERTRYYSRLRTLRIAHGLAEFLTEYVRALGPGPRTLVVEDAHRADPTDGEFVAVLLRRMDPALLTVVVGTDDGPLDAASSPAEPLGPALAAHCARTDAGGPPEPAPERGADLAARYVREDGTTDDPRAALAHAELPAPQRRALHDARRRELEALDEPSLRLGALIWHAERGSDPAGPAADLLREAANLCCDLGFYHAVLDYGERGAALVDHETHPVHWWTFIAKPTTALAALERTDGILPYYEEARATSTDPDIHLQCAYGTAMLYTRFLTGERRDYRLARGWINTAIALAGQHPDPAERAFRTAFNRNGLALIEVREGRPEAALALLDACIAHLDEVLAPGSHALHRSVLVHNRAQVHAGLGRHEDAVADYSAVIAVDPNYAEYHFDRGIVLRRTGRLDEALADFEAAVRLSPPFPEAYYNRADVRAELGDVKGAVDDFGYVLELDPAFVDARLNRASLLAELDETAAARQDVEAGLAVAPDHPELLALKAQLLAAEGEDEQAAAACSAALTADPEFAPAWALRGQLSYAAGDPAAAAADLERAVALDDDPGMRFNLAVAYQDCDRDAEAVTLLDAVIAETGDHAAHLQRAKSLSRLARAANAETGLLLAAVTDLVLAAGAEDPELADEAGRLLADLRN
ncbi:tetratricopeptide repeat protein [Kitasatospora sp. NA04385]|uniref:tetratricopeptide repeat protein n=1 Tax=Kitasatospora sp. NA04385 TaxID=2742135 RepID=UPI00159272EB|nr:tetratricopeptide repeat protein [Kitasatospora sp. NA04385]QKW19302.1 tetratricopeptide repeat protein [Kitasatospora sp. NA04385]